ncbi:hypothetical protein VTO58DRAFT_107536 [Aureobasidium pullulans]
MDHMDPLVANGLAAHRPLILYDAPGVGRSTGSTSTSFAHAATDLAAFITALDLPCVDIWGFSMGGCVAQMLALNHPHLVRKLILSGSIPSIGPGIAPPPAVPFAAIRRAQSLDEHKIAFIKFSFNDSETSQAAGVAGWERVINARQHRCWNAEQHEGRHVAGAVGSNKLFYIRSETRDHFCNLLEAIDRQLLQVKPATTVSPD